MLEADDLCVNDVSEEQVTLYLYGNDLLWMMKMNLTEQTLLSDFLSKKNFKLFIFISKNPIKKFLFIYFKLKLADWFICEQVSELEDKLRQYESELVVISQYCDGGMGNAQIRAEDLAEYVNKLEEKVSDAHAQKNHLQEQVRFLFYLFVKIF